MNWTQPNANRNNYWQSDKYDFWIAPCMYTRLWPTGPETYQRWKLSNGDYELGVYDTLAEAQDAAEPAHGVNEDKESDPVCWWCGQTHPGVICRHSGYYVEESK